MLKLLIFNYLSRVMNLGFCLKNKGFWIPAKPGFMERLSTMTVLARWVSKSRKAGEEVKVDFENRDEIPDSFLKSAAETKGAKGGMA